MVSVTSHHVANITTNQVDTTSRKCFICFSMQDRRLLGDVDTCRCIPQVVMSHLSYCCASHAFHMCLQQSPPVSLQRSPPVMFCTTSHVDITSIHISKQDVTGHNCTCASHDKSCQVCIEVRRYHHTSSIIQVVNRDTNVVENNAFHKSCRHMSVHTTSHDVTFELWLRSTCVSIVFAVLA